MRQEYGIKIGGKWDFFTIYFKDGKQVAGRVPYDLPNGINHAPTPSQLTSDGRRLLVPTEYDQATHKLVTDSYSIIDDETISQDVVDLTPQEITPKATIRLQRLLDELKSESDNRVSGHISLDEVPHWLGVANRLNRKHSLWIESPTINSQITTEEEQLWHNLEIIQGLTEAIRTASAGIANQLYQMSDSGIMSLPIDWISNHILWPE